MRANDLAGRRFGRLLAVCRAESTARGHAVWLALCDCGETKAILGTSLLRGLTVSCGCFQQESRTKHGQAGGRTYQAWQNMWGRTRNHPHYVARGITVCDRWSDFRAFRQDMGECPPGLTLERTNGAKGYSPENCIWASRAVQSANTSRTHHVVVGGEKVCLAEACRRTGKNYRTMMKRMSRGDSAQEALAYGA